MEHKILKLNNKLELIFINAPHSLTSSVQIWFKAGSALEEKSDEGIAHFLEHMFFKGTEKRPDGKITYEVETFGGEINAFTSFDYTCYYINSPKAKTLQATDILLDMVSNPLFKETDLHPERGVVFEEHRRSIDNPRQFGFMKIQDQCFQDKYKHPIIGQEETIKNFSVDQLTSFRNQFYNTNNCFLLIAGDTQSIESEIVALAEKFKLPHGPSSDFPKFKLLPKPSVSCHNKDVRMASLSIMIECPGYMDPGVENEDLAVSVLGHGESSRLYQELVTETGLANNCSASTMFFKDGGIHSISINCPVPNINKVLKLLHEVIKKLILNGYEEEEITKIKNQFLASKVYDLESTENFAFALGHSYASTNDIKSEEMYLKKIKMATRSQIQVALPKILSRPWHISAQLPQGISLGKVEKELQQFSSKQDSLIKIFKQNKPVQVETCQQDPNAKVVQIKPGIKLLYRKNPSAPTFVLHAYIKGGASEETPNNNGIYNLVAAQLTNGNKIMANEELKKFLDDSAASLSGFAGKNAYGLTLHGQTEHFKRLSEQFFASLVSPLMPQKFFKLEKELQVRALENQKEDSVRQCFLNVAQVMFPGHSYSYNQLGTIQSLKKIKDSQVKSEHSRNLKTKEILITYCGNKEFDEIYEEVIKKTATLPNRKTSKAKIPNFKYKASSNALEFKREQSQIFIGFPIAKYDDQEQIYLKMLYAFLSGQSSELFVDVRDKKGLCYSVSPIHFSALLGGYFGIFMGAGKDKVEEAVAAIADIFKRYKKSPMNNSEFLRLKEMIKGQNILNLQTNEDFASSYSLPVLHGQGIDYIYKNQSLIESMTYEKFCKSLGEILSRPMSLVIAGPDANQNLKKIKSLIAN